MSKLVHGYWNIRGVAESIRYLLNFVEAEHDDKRYEYSDQSEWWTEKFTLGLDFPNLPYLFDGDVKISQSVAILRYLSRKYKLGGQTEEETVRLDLAEQQFCDLRSQLFKVCYDSKEYEKSREEYLKTLPGKLELVSKFLGERKFVNGDKVTYVDFLMYEVLDFNRIFEASSLNDFPTLKEYMERFEALPPIEKYMKAGKFHRLPIVGPLAVFGGQKE